MIPSLVLSALVSSPTLEMVILNEAGRAKFNQSVARFEEMKAQSAARERETDARIKRVEAMIAECYRLVDQYEARQKWRAAQPVPPMPSPDPPKR